MMGRSGQDQGQLFYSFNLEAVVPDDHQVRAIARVLDLSWVRAELAPYYSHTGRPSIDPELMIRMLSRTLAEAVADGLPSNLQAFISGHLHTFSVTSFLEDLPVQIVSGHAGSALSPKAPTEVSGLSVGGKTIKAGVAKPNTFGFAIIERMSDGTAWSITDYDVRSRVLARCKI